MLFITFIVDTSCSSKYSRLTYLEGEVVLGISWNEISVNANGGTEIICRRLEACVDPALLAEIQLFPSRIREELDPTKIRIYHAHDTASDPESERALGDQRWKRFHKLVFVSNDQMHQFIRAYDLDWARCAVMLNAIDPLEQRAEKADPVRLIYTSTPQRGLDVLAQAFRELSAEFPLELDVFSSFAVYGWQDADAPFKPLFEELAALPGVRVHGARPNAEVREAVSRSHVFAYPSTWLETSCICLMEAMSAGLECVHPNLGALYETSGGLTHMYQWSPDKKVHEAVFKEKLRRAVIAAQQRTGPDRLLSEYAARVFGWEKRITEWNELIQKLLGEPRALEPVERPMFVYKVG
jgi:UDP-glucose:(glucosyl)LPS alpha-1,2-glucosyltransferase